MDPSLSSGEHAHRLIAHQYERLRRLQPEVLADRDPEPLHQFRVSLRRLRSVLRQFAPALVLPPRLNRGRIASLARATGRCRDADVLREHLEQQLLPRLEPPARGAVIQRLKHQLRRQRQRAFEELQGALTSARYHRLMERLELWLEQPGLTVLGELPVAAWLQEWLLPCTGTCFLHPGWFAVDPAAEAVHDLRKTVKEVRYGMEAVAPWLGRDGAEWIGRWRRVQSCLGDLHDQEVLLQLLRAQGRGGDGVGLTLLRIVLERDRQERWNQWLELGQELLRPERRAGLVGLCGKT